MKKKAEVNISILKNILKIESIQFLHKMMQYRVISERMT